MSAEDIKSPSFGKKFASRTPGKTFKETGAFGGTEDAELFISLYGDGFQLDTSSLLKSNPGSHLLLPGEVSLDAEFVGSKDRLEMLAYARGREQLAEYIREQMFLEFQSFGGKPGCHGVVQQSASGSERSDNAAARTGGHSLPTLFEQGPLYCHW